MDGVLTEIERAQARPGRRRPFITLAYARSLDGCLARRGERTRLSGPESLELTHRLRARHEALIIGIDSILIDDPLLTTRLVSGRSPLRVVLDTHLRTPANARALSADGAGAWIACGDGGGERAATLARAGGRIVRCPTDASGVSLVAVLDALARAGIDSVMVEGGARVLASFVGQRLVDFVCVTIAPIEIGNARSVTLGIDPLAEPSLASRRIPVGRDVLVCGPMAGEPR